MDLRCIWKWHLYRQRSIHLYPQSSGYLCPRKSLLVSQSTHFFSVQSALISGSGHGNHEIHLAICRYLVRSQIEIFQISPASWLCCSKVYLCEWSRNSKENDWFSRTHLDLHRGNFCKMNLPKEYSTHGSLWSWSHLPPRAIWLTLYLLWEVCTASHSCRCDMLFKVA